MTLNLFQLVFLVLNIQFLLLWTYIQAQLRLDQCLIPQNQLELN